MKGFKGRPTINIVSKSISRKIEDLYNWKKKCEKRQENQRNIKEEKEQQELHKL